MTAHEDFDRLSWHDCSLWGLELRVIEPDDDQGTSDLALDIDFVVEWLCGVDGPARFRVAPATLVFHGVTGLCILLIRSGGWADGSARCPVGRPWREPRCGRERVAHLDPRVRRPSSTGPSLQKRPPGAQAR